MTEKTTPAMRPEDVRPEWVAAAQEAYASAPQKRDGKPTRMIYALAAVYPAIEHQVGAKVAEEAIIWLERNGDLLRGVDHPDVDERMVKAITFAYGEAVNMLRRIAHGERP